METELIAVVVEVEVSASKCTVKYSILNEDFNYFTHMCIECLIRKMYTFYSIDFHLHSFFISVE